ncbi:MAG: hypothetical protein IKR92_03455 [Alphaproteobacteria bacterium]|nr:hypothetical protein [Alphaproteobacteria bacterium]
MLPSTKKFFRKWLRRLAILLVLGGVIWLNVHRFYYNTYANYEKAVEYGRVREYKEVINPVIAAIFYLGRNEPKADIESYMSHFDNYRTQNVKMLTVPENITDESEKVIQKLYREINRHNKVNYIVLVHNQNDDVEKHLQLLQQAFDTEEIEAVSIVPDVAATERDLNAFLQDKTSLVVLVADLKQQIGTSADDLLVNEALYFAQKNSYKIHIFDEVDTQLAQAWEDDYTAWFDDENGEESRLAMQKANLEAYISHYGAEIMRYFAENLQLAPEQEAIWPEKNVQNYRLFDRGYVYVRFFTTGGREIFSRAKIGKNKGIIVGIIELARKAVLKISQPIESAKIYLLTDLEKIEKERNMSLVKYLETDDGVYVQYRKRSALLVADERADNTADLLDLLRQRMQMPEDAALEEMEFYKFKTVEMNYENKRLQN